MPVATFDLERDIVYKTTTPGKSLKIDFFRPKTPIKATLLYAHGGGFIKGSRKDATARKLAKKLAPDGVAVASIDYRLKTGIDAFSPEDQQVINATQVRTARAGMPINPDFCGPRLYAALEDMSDAIAFLRAKDGLLSGKSGPLLALGASAGGITALSLAFPPRGVWEKLNRPDAAIGLSAAMVQPWRLSKDGLPSLLFNGCTDKIIAPENTQFTVHRVATSSAPLEVIITDVRGHNPQIDLFIDGNDPDGHPWLDRAKRFMKLPT